MAKYEARFYDEDNNDYQLSVTDISVFKYQDNLVEFTTKPIPGPAETAVVNMDKWASFTMTKMED